MYRILFFIVFSSVIYCSCKDANEASIIQNEYYSEQHRPQYHFSPDSGWMNDPNGMVYHEGEYHLFYQYYPNGIRWDSMHWGHAISPDMLHWEHLPIALYPDSLGYIFSGSAVIDHDNTSGLGKGGKAPMIAIFTHHNMEGERAGRVDFQTQSIAYSNDNGRTFTKYEGNPVIKNPGIKDFRDPNVIWDEINEQWVMVFAAYDKALFYTSPNLINWKRTGEFGIKDDDRLWECPDLFPIKVEGSEEMKWVLITSIQKKAPNGGTATSYFIGDWNGYTFIGDPNDQKWLDYGTDNYAMVTWSDVPKSDGRRLALGWMSNWKYAQNVPTEKWRSAMTLPRELRLYKDEKGYNIKSQVINEMKTIKNEIDHHDHMTISNTKTLFSNSENTLLNAHLTFKSPLKGLIQIKISNDHDEFITIGYQSDSKEFYVDRTFAGEDGFSDIFAEYHTAPITDIEDTLEFDIYLDHASVEVFFNGGKSVMTEIFFPVSPLYKIEIIAETNDVELISSKISSLDKVW